MVRMAAMVAVSNSSRKAMVTAIMNRASCSRQSTAATP